MSGEAKSDQRGRDGEGNDHGRVPDSGDASEADLLDSHRPFVRELDRKFSSVYGFGGAAVLASVGAVVTVAWFRNLLWEPAIWALAVAVGLVALFALRLVVRRRAQRLLESVEDYCRANEVEPGQLREHFDVEDRYPYFGAIFETVERRRELEDNDSESR